MPVHTPTAVVVIFLHVYIAAVILCPPVAVAMGTCTDSHSTPVPVLICSYVPYVAL